MPASVRMRWALTRSCRGCPRSASVQLAGECLELYCWGSARQARTSRRRQSAFGPHQRVNPCAGLAAAHTLQRVGAHAAQTDVEPVAAPARRRGVCARRPPPAPARAQVRCGAVRHARRTWCDSRGSKTSLCCSPATGDDANGAAVLSSPHGDGPDSSPISWPAGIQEPSSRNESNPSVGSACVAAQPADLELALSPGDRRRSADPAGLERGDHQTAIPTWRLRGSMRKAQPPAVTVQTRSSRSRLAGSQVTSAPLSSATAACGSPLADHYSTCPPHGRRRSPTGRRRGHAHALPGAARQRRRLRRRRRSPANRGRCAPPADEADGVLQPAAADAGERHGVRGHVLAAGEQQTERVGDKAGHRSSRSPPTKTSAPSRTSLVEIRLDASASRPGGASAARPSWR